MRNSPPRRVLMIGDTVGGVWTFTMELAEALAEHGVEVMLAAMGGRATVAQSEEAARVPGLRLHTADYKLEWMDDPWQDVAESGRWLEDLAARFAPDVVHLNTFGHGGLDWNAPVMLTAHSCVTSWWQAVKSEPLPQRWDRYRRAVEQSMEAAVCLVAPSRAMLEVVDRNYGRSAPRDRRVIPNGRNRRCFATAHKEPFILCAGRLWDEAKNAAAVARVAPQLPWPVYLAGDARGPEGRTEQFPGCHLLGNLSSTALAGWFSRAAIFALPARYEPFGLSALEAALSGCALVLGDIPSLREIWGDTAVYVDPNDSDQLGAELQYLTADASRRFLLAQRAQSRARMLTPQRMAQGYLDVYCAAMESRRAACVS